MTSGFDSSGEFHEHCTHVVSTLDLLPGDLLCDEINTGWSDRVTGVERFPGSPVAAIDVARTSPEGIVRPTTTYAGIAATHEVIR